MLSRVLEHRDIFFLESFESFCDSFIAFSKSLLNFGSEISNGINLLFTHLVKNTYKLKIHRHT